MAIDGLQRMESYGMGSIPTSFDAGLENSQLRGMIETPDIPDTIGGFDYSDSTGTGIEGALSLLQGVAMGRFDANLPTTQGLDIYGPPPSFNQAAAEAEVQRAQSFGQQKGSKIGQGIGTGVGFLLAPLTGGLSIPLGSALGSGIGGMVGGSSSRMQVQDMVDARRKAANRIGMAYRDVTSEMGVNQARSQGRAEDLEMMRRAAFGDNYMDYYNV